MKFSELNCNINEDVQIVNFNGIDIEVKQYLPASEKEDIINAVMQNADTGTVVDTFLEDVLFNVYLIFEYTNIEFTDEERQSNIYELFDKFNCSGLLDLVINAIPKDEYGCLLENIERIHAEYLTYRDSARAAFEQMSIFAPNTAANIGEQVSSFDVDKFKEISNVANTLGINN